MKSFDQRLARHLQKVQNGPNMSQHVPTQKPTLSAKMLTLATRNYAERRCTPYMSSAA
jgi:hypothetical protein